MTHDYYIYRQVESVIYEALKYVKIVALVGPRASGKTTLLTQIASRQKQRVVDFDNHQTRSRAEFDLDEFIEMNLGEGGLAIDEIQRIPHAVLALKRAVDKSPQPGRFIVTGSVDYFNSIYCPDSLAGRLKIIELLPLSQAEITKVGRSEIFEDLFTGKSLASHRYQRETRSELIQRMIRGGYPDFYGIHNHKIRQELLRDYTKTLLSKDSRDLGPIRMMSEFSQFTYHLATLSGGLVNWAKLGTQLGVNHKTLKSWCTILEQLFLVRMVPGWHKQDSKKIRKRSKVYFLDTALLCALRSIRVEDIDADGKILGQLFETFVFTEIAKNLGCHFSHTQISAYRDSSQSEVDFILERDQLIIAVEVKASRVVSQDALKSLKKIQRMCPDTFQAGVVLYAGDELIKTDCFYLMPATALWT